MYIEHKSGMHIEVLDLLCITLTYEPSPLARVALRSASVLFTVFCRCLIITVFSVASVTHMFPIANFTVKFSILL